MKLNKVTLNNFRQYIGENTVEFCSGDKNVTLIFGENGFGKTGIFRAIMFALYGLRYLKQDNLTKEEQNEGLILVNEKLLETHPNEDIEASVTLEFEDNNKKYILKRIISARKLPGDKPRQEPKGVSLVITENYNTLPPIVDITEIDNIISTIINKKIKDFFLFDGEQIEELTKYSKESKEEVKNGIRTLLNLDAVEIAKEVFKKKLRSLDNDIEKNASGKLELVSEQLNNKNIELQNIENYIEKLNQNLDSAIKEENEIEKQISENKSIIEKQKDRDAIKAKIKETQNYIGGLKQKLKESISHSGIYIAEQAVHELFYELDQKFKRGEISNISKEYIESLINRGRCICGTDLNSHPEANETLIRFKDLLNNNSEDLFDIYSLLGELKGEIKIVTNNIDNDLLTYNKNLEELAILEKKLETYNDEVKGLNYDLGDKLQKTKSDIRRIQEEIGQNNNKKTGLISEIKRLSEEQEKLSLTDQKSKKFIEQKKLIDKAHDEISRIYNEYSDELRIKLSDCATEIFKQIASKTTLSSLAKVVILDDFQLEVLSKNGTTMLSNISAGEKVIVSLSYIGALLQVGANLEMPLLMDTPFGRLSSSPREECIKNLPKLLSQWILLTTDTELQQEEASLLRESNRWGKVYEIKHIADRESRIEEKDINNWIPIKTTQRSI